MQIKKSLLLALLFPALVTAQEVKTIHIESYCVKLSDLEATLSEFGELPFVRGVGHREPVGIVSMVLFVNPETKSWTVVEKMSTDNYCVVAAGAQLDPVPSKIINDLKESRKKGSGL